MGRHGWGLVDAWLLSAALLVLAVAGALVLLWTLRAVVLGRPRRADRSGLDEQFARGDLSIDEYRRRRHGLGGR